MRYVRCVSYINYLLLCHTHTVMLWRRRHAPHINNDAKTSTTSKFIGRRCRQPKCIRCMRSDAPFSVRFAATTAMHAHSFPGTFSPCAQSLVPNLWAHGVRVGDGSASNVTSAIANKFQTHSWHFPCGVCRSRLSCEESLSRAATATTMSTKLSRLCRLRPQSTRTRHRSPFVHFLCLCRDGIWCFEALKFGVVPWDDKLENWVVDFCVAHISVVDQTTTFLMKTASAGGSQWECAREEFLHCNHPTTATTARTR